MGQFTSGIAILMFAASASMAMADSYTVNRSIEITADPEAVWQAVGDFCDVDDWHPAVMACALKAQDGSVHRRLTLADGAEFFEKLVAVEQNVSYTYRIVESPLPVTNYVATFSIARGNPNQITWSGRFRSDDPEMEAVIAGIYEAGLAELSSQFGE